MTPTKPYIVCGTPSQNGGGIMYPDSTIDYLLSSSGFTRSDLDPSLPLMMPVGTGWKINKETYVGIIAHRIKGDTTRVILKLLYDEDLGGGRVEPFLTQWIGSLGKIMTKEEVDNFYKNKL